MSEKLKPEDYLGMEVVVPAGANTEWYGTAIAFRDEPSVMIQTEGGLRLMLPADRVRLAYPLPKPWHDAKPGEVWLITDDRQNVFEMTCVDGDGGAEFFTHHRRHSTRYTGITAGRMIWPEAVES